MRAFPAKSPQEAKSPLAGGVVLGEGEVLRCGGSIAAWL